MKKHRSRKGSRVRSNDDGVLFWSYAAVRGTHPCHTAEDMAAYDSLPPQIRKALSDGAWNISPLLVKEAYDHGASQHRIVLQLWRYNALMSLAYRKTQGWPP